MDLAIFPEKMSNEWNRTLTDICGEKQRRAKGQREQFCGFRWEEELN